MANNLKLTIATPEKIVYQDEITQATIPTKAGEITVLARHTPMVGIIQNGELIIKKKDEHELSLAVSRGVVEVRPNSEVVILTDFAEYAKDIDLAQAEEGRRRVDDMLKEKDKLSDEEFAHFEAQLERELLRIKIGSRKRS